MKNLKIFLKRNWTLVVVLLYFVFPDLIPGYFDDAALILIERLINKNMNEKRESLENKS